MRKILILGSFIVLGLSLRIQYLNFPSIGYHNMKENEYLSMAKEMARTQDLVNKRIYFYNAFSDNPVVKNDPQPPLISYQILLAWNLLGENIWGPRLFNILFGLFSILIIYFISNLLFDNKNISLFPALLLAIMPLAVFFSRNIQPESPAFFFMLLGNLFYLRFIRTFKKYNLILAGLATCFAWAYKFNFIIGIFPILFCLPYKELFKNKKDFFKFIFMLLLPYSAILVAIVLLRLVGQWVFNFQFKPFEALLPSYWKNYADTILTYTKEENFTFIYSLLASCGICLAFFKNKGLLNRYIIGWGLSIVFYFMLFPEDLHLTNYSQMPFLGLVCISSTYVISFISEELKKFIKKDIVIYVGVFIVGISSSFAATSLSRMQTTIFFGEDVAGESLKEFTAADERIFLLTHAQGYAIARYAQRYVGWPNTLDDFKEKEKKYGIRFICVYPGEFIEVLKRNSPATFEYIDKNYRVREIGIIENPNRLIYLILEKGYEKGKKIADVLQPISVRPEPRSIYKLEGAYIFFYAIRFQEDSK